MVCTDGEIFQFCPLNFLKMTLFQTDLDPNEAKFTIES